MWENVEKYGKTAVFSGQLGPDWGNTERAATVGLGSMELKSSIHFSISTLCNSEIQSGDTFWISEIRFQCCWLPVKVLIIFFIFFAHAEKPLYFEALIIRIPVYSNLLIISK